MDPQEPAIRYGWEFFCKTCAIEFEADWQPDDDIICPCCHSKFATRWERNRSGQIIGPWLTSRVSDDDRTPARD